MISGLLNTRLKPLVISALELIYYVGTHYLVILKYRFIPGSEIEITYAHSHLTSLHLHSLL
jgi:hypothetical protein